MPRTPTTPPVVVVGLDCITGLQTARIFSGRGVPVVGVAGDATHFCCRTRVCDQVIQAEFEAPALIDTLIALGEELEARAVLCPCTDIAVLLLSEDRERLESRFDLALPDPQVVRTLMNKIDFLHYASEHGLSIPQTFLLHDERDARQAASSLDFPCILKPPMKSHRWAANTRAKAYKVESAEEFLALYQRCRHWADVLMAQQWVEGGDGNLFSCNCYFSKDVQPLAAFVARKIRQWPPETGTSCLGEEVQNDEVLTQALALFKQVDYHGLGYVEIKRDERSGRHYIIEPNIGRPTGRSAIAEAGGVELLYTMYCDLVGLPLPAERQQRYRGVKWIYWRNDILSALHYWRRGDLGIADIFRSWRGKKACAVLSFHDPMPFLADLWRSLALLVSGVKER